MNRHSLFRVAAAFDPGRLVDPELLLTRAERLEFENLPTERRRRHYLIGRIAAGSAIHQLLGPALDGALIEILNEPESAPCVVINGRTGEVAISISHSGHLAVACAWPTRSPILVSAGVDLELIRPNEVADSRYAFSRRERKLLAHLPEGPQILGLAGWTVKESVWKALEADQAIGPDAIDIYELSLEKGLARVQVTGRLAGNLGNNWLAVETDIVEQSGESYILSLAQVIASRSPAVQTGIGLQPIAADSLAELRV